MKTNRFRMLISMCLLLSAMFIRAQEVYVNDVSGQNCIPLSQLKKITFSVDEMHMHIANGQLTTYRLSELHYLSFQDFLTIEQLTSSVFATIRVYPNPVGEHLYINFGQNEQKFNLSILNIEGKQVKSVSLLPMERQSVDISDLSAGVYVCLFSSGIDNKAIKIIKQ